FLIEQRIDVVNTHSGVDSWIGGLAAKWARTPVLLRTRHLNLPLKRSPLNFVHQLPDRIITCGEAIRAELISRDRFPAGQLVSIPTGIDFESFKPQHGRSATRKNLGLAESDFVILMVGILRTVKGHDIALRAFQAISSELSQARLVLAGDGPWQAELERLAGTLRVTDRVRFLGFRDDVPDLMAAADMLLLTSRSEGVPQAVTQAMHAGLPVVAARVGGVPELITHEQNGLLVASEDPAATAAAARRIIQEPNLARRFAAAGRVHVETRFNLKTMLDRTEQLCTRLLAERRRGSRPTLLRI
ncbi:MAG: glycosyltransferase family 4 protein, partial [Verrucomicrobia bacterium]|nr:glycosyltransferase family 4 protein [Verrucomicrobiota bacterium]